jgi:hypothetical protein
MRRALLVAVLAQSACGERPRDGAGNDGAVAATQGDVISTRSNGGSSYCGFVLGQAAPANPPHEAMEVVKTEGDDRLFYRYRSCDGPSSFEVEVVDGQIDSIRLSGTGDCLGGLCVGSTYADAVANQPNAKLLLSRVEGDVFSLAVDRTLTASFDPAGLPGECFDHPDSCSAVLGSRKITSVTMHR